MGCGCEPRGAATACGAQRCSFSCCLPAPPPSGALGAGSAWRAPPGSTLPRPCQRAPRRCGAGRGAWDGRPGQGSLTCSRSSVLSLFPPPAKPLASEKQRHLFHGFGPCPGTVALTPSASLVLTQTRCAVRASPCSLDLALRSPPARHRRAVCLSLAMQRMALKSFVLGSFCVCEYDSDLWMSLPLQLRGAIRSPGILAQPEVTARPWGAPGSLLLSVSRCPLRGIWPTRTVGEWPACCPLCSWNPSSCVGG